MLGTVGAGSRSHCSPSHSIVCRTQQGLIYARGIPIGGRAADLEDAPGVPAAPPCARRDYFSLVSSRPTPGKIVPSRVRARKGTCEARAGGAARGSRGAAKMPENHIILTASARESQSYTSPPPPGVGGPERGRRSPRARLHARAIASSTRRRVSRRRGRDGFGRVS